MQRGSAAEAVVAPWCSWLWYFLQTTSGECVELAKLLHSSCEHWNLAVLLPFLSPCFQLYITAGLPSDSCFPVHAVQAGWGSLIPLAQFLGLCCWLFWHWWDHSTSVGRTRAAFTCLWELGVSTVPLFLRKNCALGKACISADKWPV